MQYDICILDIIWLHNATVEWSILIGVLPETQNALASVT